MMQAALQTDFQDEVEEAEEVMDFDNKGSRPTPSRINLATDGTINKGH